MEAGSNTSTVALRVVGGEDKGPSAWGYKVTHLLGDIRKYGDLALQVAAVSNLRE
jgi:hypothetical protein